MAFRLLHLHLHGLFRSHDLELGRDADTGGQTLYVLELVKALAASKEVEQVDVITRLIDDKKVSSDYAQKQENICKGAVIRRFPFGPRRYLRKELLWPYLDSLADQLVFDLKKVGKLPDFIHAHYADAGYVGALISKRLDIPLIFTGHSLGREKKRRLIQSGVTYENIENNYFISKRIEGEELALSQSNAVITSTLQEANNQYSRYRNFVLTKANVVPPGVDLTRFHPTLISSEDSSVEELFKPFLSNLHLPPFLAISRAVRRKNIPTLVEAFGRSPILRKRHNLILILGNRTDMRLLDKQQKEVFHQIFELIDRYDLYGQVALPKSHKRDQISSIYRWAAARKGLFVNPALTEPFGLTLLESAACGLPTVATDDGGPSEILSFCGNGLLADVTDIDSLQTALEQGCTNQHLWKRWQKNGIEGIQKNFSWDAHVDKYLQLLTNQIKLKSSNSDKITSHLSGIIAS